MALFTQLVLYTAIAALVTGENCDHLGVLLYEDLACKPTPGPEPCPSSFQCRLSSEPDTCLVQGKVYKPEDHIEDNSIGFSCQFGCFCQQGFRVRCAEFSCAEYSGLPPSPGCYRTYDLDKCCSSGEKCPPFNNETKCVVDGVTYREGERFVPKDSCHVCRCLAGFNGRLEAPFCKRSGCDQQLLNQDKVQKHCAPVYLKRDGAKKCCPGTWTCPGEDERLVLSSAGKLNGANCKFGDVVLKVGDSFRKKIQYSFRALRIKCECKVPPLLICTEDDGVA